MKVAVSGAMGRLGNAIAHGITQAEDLHLTGAYAPGHVGKSLANIKVSDKIEDLDAEVMVECAPPNVVMNNIQKWRDKRLCVVIGTSGFTADRIEEVKAIWSDNDSGCLIVPNFSIGAVMMMRFAEMAASHFHSAEIIERHEEKKPDAPSGTALATAMRMGKQRDTNAPANSKELIKGVRGGLVEGIRVHSLRMKGILSDQEVAFSNQGEIFSIHHSSTSYASFVNGALLAIRYVNSLKGVEVGLDRALGF